MLHFILGYVIGIVTFYWICKYYMKKMSKEIEKRIK